MLAFHDLHKTDIGPFRKTFVTFQNRSQRFHRRRINIVDLNHTVRITH